MAYSKKLRPYAPLEAAETKKNVQIESESNLVFYGFPGTDEKKLVVLAFTNPERSSDFI